ncbi:MAG: hypothetical protein SGBAC_006112 [Bacillariaceae sp.]
MSREETAQAAVSEGNHHATITVDTSSGKTKRKSVVASIVPETISPVVRHSSTSSTHKMDNKKKKRNHDDAMIVFDFDHDEGIAFDSSGNPVNPAIPRTISLLQTHPFTKVIGDSTFKFYRRIVQLKLNQGLQRIGNNAFQGCQSLELVAVPISVNTIGRYAFANCSGLQVLVFSEGQRCEVWASAFEKCQSLRRIVKSTSMISIGPFSFNGCKLLADVEFSTDLQRVGIRAFENCDSFQKLAIPSSLAKKGGSIGDYAFAFCRSLAEVELPRGLTELPEGTLSGCVSLRQISISAVSTVCLPLVDPQVALLPLSLRTIGNHAFANCERLSVLILPKGLNAIGSYAFRRLVSLKRISVPDSVESIGERAFEFCVLLVEVALSNGLKQIGNLCFQGCTALTSVPCSIKSTTAVEYRRLTNVNLFHGVQEIGKNAFADCEALKRISVPATTKIIQSEAFRKCYNLVDVEFQEGLTRIGSRAFQKCTSICTISLPESLEHVEADAFSSCTSLRGAEIPFTSEGIQFEPRVFNDCRSLANVSIPQSVDAIAIFRNCHFLASAVNSPTDSAFPFSIRRGNTNYFLLLNDRYASLPIHQACYHASTTTVDELKAAMQSSPGNVQKDAFGLTPFHVLASSCKLRLDLLGVLLDAYGTDPLSDRDNLGDTMVDYLLINQSSASVSYIKAILHRAVIGGMANWGVSGWRLDVSRELESLRWEGTVETRWQALKNFRRVVARYVKKERKCLLELGLWKTKIQSMERQEGKTQRADREMCRFANGGGGILWSLVGSFIPLEELSLRFIFDSIHVRT